MEGLDWWESALESAIQKLADNLRVAVLLDREESFRHALALFRDFRNAVEALVLLRKGWIMRVPLRGE